MKKVIWFFVVGTLCIMPALADRAIDKKVDAEPNGEVSIELIAGHVRIVGSERNEVHVTGTVGDDVEDVVVKSHRGRVSIEVKLPSSERGGNYRDADADLEISVPTRSAIKAESISAGLELSKLEGTIDLESISGEIEVEGAIPEASLASVSGAIKLNSTGPLEEGEFETVSGSIRVRAALAPGADLSLESVSGDVTLSVPANTSAEFEVETFSGRIDNAFGPEAQRTSDYAPGKELEFSTGGGDADVKIESFSGRVEIRKD